MTNQEFDDAVRAALREVPDEFRPYLENVLIEVQPRPDRTLHEAGEPDDLLGLYLGVPLEDKLLGGAGQLMPDRILIFRENLCEMCESWEDLVEEIRITVLHEIGHHFGLDENRLDELGYA